MILDDKLRKSLRKHGNALESKEATQIFPAAELVESLMMIALYYRF